MTASAITPLEEHGGIVVKRDDLFTFGGSAGGKVRSCLALATADPAPPGLVTSSARHSPQAGIVAGIAAELAIGCRVHYPESQEELTPELAHAAGLGAVLIPVRPGYNSVIIKAAREDAARSGWREIPFGMECAAAVEENARQAEALPKGGYKRIVVPVGSGMSLAGILTGMSRAGNWTPVLGIMVGADRTGKLDEWAPYDWRTRAVLRHCGQPYSRQVEARVGDVLLDPVYEAKCAEFLEPGDLLWIVGIRPGAQPWDGRTLTISAATLDRALDCTAHGITRPGGCGGLCCTSPSYWPPMARPQADGRSCHYLGAEGCTLDGADRPVKCLLYPLMVTPGRAPLRFHFRAPNGYCKPNYQRGPRLAEALRPSLTALLGEAEAERVVAEAMAGRDVRLELPAAVAEALAAEHEEEARNALPPPRSTR